MSEVGEQLAKLQPAIELDIEQTNELVQVMRRRIMRPKRRADSSLETSLLFQHHMKRLRDLRALSLVVETVLRTENSPDGRIKDQLDQPE